MLSRSIFGMRSLHRLERPLAEQQWRLEGALDCKVEQGPDQVVVTFEERNRSSVPETRIDNAADCVEAVASSENIEDAGPDRQAHEILVLDEQAVRRGDVECPDDLGQEIVLGKMVILIARAPGEGRARNVVAQLRA